jgi:hypothetical protein
MPTQAEIDAGQDQASIDTAAAKGKQNNNNQAAIDTAAAKAKQKGGGGVSTIGEREAAAGLTNTGGSIGEREEASGLKGTTTGREKPKRTFNETTRSGEYQRRIDKMAEAEQVGTPQGNVHFVSSITTASSGGGQTGIEIIFADQTEAFISAGTILDTYDGEGYWSVVFGVSAGAFTQAVAFDATQVLWDDVGSNQAEYRLRVKTLDGDSDPTQISAYGQYREDILCVDGEPVVTLLKIS